MYHAQTFNGNRYAELRNTDYHFGALILYVLFAGIFILYLYITSNILVNLENTRCSRINSTDAIQIFGISLQNIFEKTKHAENFINNREHEKEDLVSSRKKRKAIINI